MSRKAILLGNQIVAIVERKGDTVDITFTDDIKVDHITAVIEHGKLAEEDYEVEFSDEEEEVGGSDEHENGNG
jgi:hypothetical protein